MTELSKLNVSLNIPGNEIKSNINQLTQFSVIVQNVGYKPMPRIFITLTGPREIRIPVKSKSIGYLKPGKARNIPFKIRPKLNGIYDLTVNINRKATILATLPIKLIVGVIPSYQQPPPAIQAQYSTISVSSKAEVSAKGKELVSMITCPYCKEKIEDDSSFCPNCGMELKERKEEAQQMIVCPNCGSSLIKGARFCGECGREIE